ncbi:TetR/AcrR family transcriptional regulator [Paenibacillus tritici]|uniref:TetR/AcrR family transcriptional regulator n=1 Tax=Paenibacillus tritici TaxID=1873425 RepID=A0ABX2DP02_9BACL|nr:TetR/AcrR family transcriptional regulator [Paenibacillus tritici]NQX46391.1 TetR/AcrR family transcriptional regulator [Paenibacillus tritici]QUL54777.1 TetR/AcrR family transcriptional regulator [Paenibacillus tritici]
MNKQSRTIPPKGDEAAPVNRREQILEAAVVVFAEHGYSRATTAQVAEKVGISQPYIFKLFKNKEELFIAALERAFERIIRTFSGLQAPEDRLLAEAIQVYEQLMETHPNEIILQVQAIGIRDEAIRQAMQAGILEVTRLMEGKFSAAGFAHPEVEVSTFMANGMLCNIALTLEMPELKPKHR